MYNKDVKPFHHISAYHVVYTFMELAYDEAEPNGYLRDMYQTTLLDWYHDLKDEVAMSSAHSAFEDFYNNTEMAREDLGEFESQLRILCDKIMKNWKQRDEVIKFIIDGYKEEY
ncbi:hypothetical protein_gp269 [Bacillus phage vB_BceM_WH1]|nr:hypothetical protein_gp269 [Bacillus phage vB_BceM_WH1]